MYIEIKIGITENDVVRTLKWKKSYKIDNNFALSEPNNSLLSRMSLFMSKKIPKS